MNILRSGLWSSLGGGGLFGGLFASCISGSRMSFVAEFPARESRDVDGEVGVDMLAWIEGRGSLMMGEFSGKES
jgi:hypothetical protein